MSRIVANILRRLLVKGFYKDNTGFFLFWFFLLFGSVSGGQLVSFHLSLINGIVQSFVFLGCVTIAWLLYTLKCNSYICKKLKDPHNNFLQVLCKTSAGSQYIQLLWVHIQVYMPVLLYTLIVAGVAFHKGLYIPMVLTLSGDAAMIVLSGLLYRAQLQGKNPYGFAFPNRIRLHIAKPLFLLPCWFLVKEQKQVLLSVKIFSFVLLYLFTAFYEPERHDIRPIMLVLLLIAAAHSFIVLRVRNFEETYLAFSRGLPIGTLKRFTGLVAMYAALLLPELVYIWKAYPAAFLAGDYPAIWLFVVSLPVFFHSILLMKDIDPDSYVRIVFISCAVVFFVLLYNPGVLFSLGVLLLAFVFFHAHFYTFEKEG